MSSKIDIVSSGNGVKVLASDLEKPAVDSRSYKVIELPNKLQVFLVHDSETDKASAALDVHVGSFSDKEELQGQAHALEHLLFMGTVKYPQENEYSKYLNEHSGYSNAYTAATSTNYYFEVGHEYFQGALDRFAQFFIAPLFLEETLDRELKAVDSENKKNLQNDKWRWFQLSKSLSNPKHPYHKFSTGNLETLKELPAQRGINVRDEFMKFHEKYYSANLMKLVVFGREDLDTLENMVVELFKDVKNKDVPVPHFEAEPLLDEHMLKEIFIKPVMETRSLELVFRFLDEENLFRTHPSRYISHLIGHEGQGSILSYLKNKGWANSLSAGPTPIEDSYALFGVRMKLTEVGLENYEEIVKVVFAYINLIKDYPPQEWIFRELQSTTNIDFKYREMSPASKFTSRYASVMQKPFPREWLLSGTSLLRDWDPALVTKSLEYLRPDNFRIMIQAPECSKGDFNAKEKWYQTEYRVDNISGKLLSDLKKTATKGQGAGEFSKDLYLPMPNPYITNNHEVNKKIVEVPQKTPTLIKNNEMARIWFKKDDTFWVPKANVYITLRNLLVYSTPANHITALLYCDLVKDALNEDTYDASIAGLDFHVSSSTIGLEMEMSGYNEKMSTLLEHILTTMRNLKVSDERFNVIKERTIRSYRNWTLQQPYYQIDFSMRYLGAVNMWLNEDLLVELEDVTADDVRNLYPKILKSVHIEALVHGNLYKEDALKYIDMVQSILGAKAIPVSQHNIRRSLIPARNEKVVWVRELKDPKNVNSCVEVAYYVGEQKDCKLRMLLAVFAQLTEEPSFDQLRTKEQLGYIVFSGIRTGNTTMLYRIIVQSSRTAPYLESRIEEFIKNYKEKLDALSVKDFEGHVKAVILQKQERHKNMGQESRFYWNRIGYEIYDFLQLEDDVEMLKTLKKEDMVEFYNTYISPNSPNRTKISCHMTAAVTPGNEGKLTILTEALTQFLGVAGGLTVEAIEISKAFENVDIESMDDIVERVGTLLKAKKIPDNQVGQILAQGRAILEKALPAGGESDKFKSEDFGTVLENVIAWKANCSISAGAQPKKPIVEYEETNSKL